MLVASENKWHAEIQAGLELEIRIVTTDPDTQHGAALILNKKKHVQDILEEG